MILSYLSVIVVVCSISSLGEHSDSLSPFGTQGICTTERIRIKKGFITLWYPVLIGNLRLIRIFPLLNICIP